VGSSSLKNPLAVGLGSDGWEICLTMVGLGTASVLVDDGFGSEHCLSSTRITGSDSSFVSFITIDVSVLMSLSLIFIWGWRTRVLIRLLTGKLKIHF